MDPQLFVWIVARATGVAAYIALCLSILSGIALRTSVLDFLAKNRALRSLHDFMTWVWIPLGFAHGYVTLAADCEVIYKVTDYYAPDCDRGIAWDDPALAIDWRIPAGDLLLSHKDRNHPRLSDAALSFQFVG